MAAVKWFQMGVLDLQWKLKMGRPKCPSAELKSIWLSTRAIDCICKLALRVLAGRKKEKKQKKKQHCVSKFRTQRAIPLFSCLFYSKCHSVSESAFGALRQRCRCSGLNIYDHIPNGVDFTRAQEEGGLGLLKITQQPPPAKLKAIKDHPDALCCGRTLSDLI